MKSETYTIYAVEIRSLCVREDYLEPFGFHPREIAQVEFDDKEPGNKAMAKKCKWAATIFVDDTLVITGFRFTRCPHGL